MFPKTTVKAAWLSLAIAVAYMVAAAALVGFKPEQAGLTLFCVALYYASAGTRKFLFAFGAFIVFWVLFDFMKALPNYEVSPVHIRDLYETDKQWFHIGARSVNEYWKAHATTALDLLSGGFYICWMPVPLGFGIYLFVKRRNWVVPFALTFLWVNILGWIVYYTFPAAPPWYVQLHGFGFDPHTPGSTAGLARFDDYFHIHLFQGLYAKSSNVFAAMPSLHAAYPLVTFYYGLRSRASKAVSAFLGVVVLGIWFAAVYTGHHYVLDVLAGITVAVIGILLWEKVLMRSKGFKKFLGAYQALVA